MMLERINRQKWRRWAVNGFIALHLYVMAVWGLPGSAWRTMFSRPIERYVIPAGLWHSWDMFSPDPLAINFHLDAYVTFQDGSMKVWDFPRMERLGLWERFQMERFRKWRERVRQDSFQMVWDDTARYIARQHGQEQAGGTNPPVQVMLARHWSAIPRPVVASGEKEPIDYQRMIEAPVEFERSYRFKMYTVQPQDLALAPP